MRIGIITFHSAHNYGAVLQCYALQEFLKTYGHDVFIIDHRIHEIDKHYKCFNISRFTTRRFKRTIKEFLIFPQRVSRYNNFNRFILSHFNLLEDNLINKHNLDLIIIGSDQVWNINLTGGFDTFYWGKAIDVSRTKLISYAASMEEYWGQPNDNTAFDLLNRFSAISVREVSLQRIISHLLPLKNINVCVDPTLLLPSNFWDKLSTSVKINKPYLLLYQVRSSSKVYSIAKKLAKEKGLDLICLSAAVSEKNNYSVASSSPSDFISLFKHASFVVATSFHGTVFSVIFHKEFLSLKLDDGRDSRYFDFLSKIGLLSRLRGINDIIDNSEIIDYNLVDEKIQVMKESSIKYLEQYI